MGVNYITRLQGKELKLARVGELLVDTNILMLPENVVSQLLKKFILAEIRMKNKEQEFLVFFSLLFVKFEGEMKKMTSIWCALCALGKSPKVGWA